MCRFASARPTSAAHLMRIRSACEVGGPSEKSTDQASSKASMQKGGTTKNTERPAGDGRRLCFISWVNLHEDYMCFGGNVRKLRNNFQRGSQQNQTDRMYTASKFMSWQQQSQCNPSVERCGSTLSSSMSCFWAAWSGDLARQTFKSRITMKNMYNKLFRWAMVIPHSIGGGWRCCQLTDTDGIRTTSPLVKLRINGSTRINSDKPWLLFGFTMFHPISRLRFQGSQWSQLCTVISCHIHPILSEPKSWNRLKLASGLQNEHGSCEASWMHIQLCHGRNWKNIVTGAVHKSDRFW